MALGNAVVFVAYYVAAVFGMQFVALPPGNLTVVWLPSGIGMGALMLGGRRLLPGVLLASFAANMPHFLSIDGTATIVKGVSLGMVIAGLDAAQAYVGYWFHRRWIGQNIFASRLATLKYYGLLAVMAPLLTVWAMVLLPYWTGYSPAAPTEVVTRIVAVTFADMLGVILVLPLVFAWHSLRRHRLTPRQLALSGVMGLVLVGTCHLAFYQLELIIYATIPVLFALTLLGRNLGFSFGMAILSFYSIRGTTLDLGPFVEGTDSLSFVHLFVFIVSISLLFSFLLAAANEMEQAKAELEVRNQDLNELTSTLENRIEEKTRDLVAAKAQADAANEAKSVFLANISHEIRTPLNGVVGMTEALRTTSLGTDQHDYVETIEQCSHLLLELINQLLDLSKIESGEFTLRERPFDLHRLMRDMQVTYGPRAQRQGLEFICDLPADLPTWWQGDPTRLRQILENLLSNALKFTTAGRVRLAVSPGDSTTSTLCFEVSDTGAGIAPEYQERLFDKFYQVDASVTRPHQGSGLGLAIVQQLARLMRGDVRVESSPDTGSTFFVHVQLTQTAAPASAPVSPSSASVAQPALKILVAEDNEVNSKVLELMLTKMGHQITHVTSGLAAVERLRNEDFDVVLMDVQMPEMDGLTATREIRRPDSGIRQGAHIPIIALTAHAMPEDLQQTLQAGMNSYLTKPITSESLATSLWELQQRPNTN